MNEPAPPDDRIPRGALAVVALGLLATLAAWLLSTDQYSGASARLEWVESARVPDSEPVDVPGGGGEMRLVDGLISATGTNVSGYALFRVANTLVVDAGSPVGDAQILCVTEGGPRSEIARSGEGLRALYPRSADGGIYTQNVPEALLIDFSARGGENVIVEYEDLGIRGYTSERGVKLEWPEYTEGTERLKYFIAGGKPKDDLVLPFNTIWKTTAPPAATVSCTVRTSAGESTATTKAALTELPPPIDEEAEEASEEQLEDEEEEEAAEEADE